MLIHWQCSWHPCLYLFCTKSQGTYNNASIQVSNFSIHASFRPSQEFVIFIRCWYINNVHGNHAYTFAVQSKIQLNNASIQVSRFFNEHVSFRRSQYFVIFSRCWHSPSQVHLCAFHMLECTIVGISWVNALICLCRGGGGGGGGRELASKRGNFFFFACGLVSWGPLLPKEKANIWHSGFVAMKCTGQFFVAVFVPFMPSKKYMK